MTYGKESATQYIGRNFHGINNNEDDPDMVYITPVEMLVFQTVRDPNVNKKGFFRILYLFEDKNSHYFLRLLYDDDQDYLVQKIGYDPKKIHYSSMSPEQAEGIPIPRYYPNSLYVEYPENTYSLKDVNWYKFEPFFWNNQIMEVVDADC